MEGVRGMRRAVVVATKAVVLAVGLAVGLTLGTAVATAASVGAVSVGQAHSDRGYRRKPLPAPGGLVAGGNVNRRGVFDPGLFGRWWTTSAHTSNLTRIF